MPDYLVGQARDVMSFVKVYAGGLLHYGWNTKDLTGLTGVSSADITALGHKDAAAVGAITGAIAILGANSPKPARFKKVVNRNPSASQQGSVSTFCDADSFATALSAGWKLTKSVRTPKISNNGRTVTVGAKCTDGGIYLFPMNATRAAEVAGELGLILPSSLSTSERQKAFTGTSYPRPYKVSLPGANGDKSTFASSDTIDSATSAGWNIDESEILFAL